jgi:hypothetical protein
MPTMVVKLARGNSRSNRKLKKGIIEMQSFKKSSISRKMLAVGFLFYRPAPPAQPTPGSVAGSVDNHIHNETDLDDFLIRVL